MIVVDTVLPDAGSSLVIVFFSMVVVDCAKAGAANNKTAPATTSGRIILITSHKLARRVCSGAPMGINRMSRPIIPP
jgi:hypothetical protein